MKKIDVQYQGGESRMHPGEAVDFMLVTVDDVELYAEMDAQDEEDASYDALKAEILDQAAAHGISSGDLHFWYDD